MRIVLAPDSFKHSLSAPDAAAALAAGVRRVLPDADCVLRPMADGGEGTVEALLAGGGERRNGTVTGPLGTPVQAFWGWLADGTAVIEVAAAAGLALVGTADRDAGRADSQGVGEQILAALDAGARHIVLGLGGSATTDAGAGLLRALGVRWLDAAGHPLPPGGAALARLDRIELAGLDPRIAHTRFSLACDVDNPLCGPQGAAAVFGPQKGATPRDAATLDAALSHAAQVCARTLGRDCSATPGAGAAGGIGFAGLAFLGATLRPGADWVAQACDLAGAMAGADLVLTGEGRIDGQTVRGKTPVGVARVAAQAGVPVVAIAGALGPGHAQVHEHGIAAVFSLVDRPMDLDEALAQAGDLLADRAEQVLRLWLAARGARA